MALNEVTRRALEDLMANGHYEYQSDFAKKYVAEGGARGEAKGRARAGQGEVGHSPRPGPLHEEAVPVITAT